MDKNDKRNQSGGMFGRVQDEFAVRSATAIVDFATEEIQPPSLEYIGVDDQLVTSFIGQGTNQSCTVNLRILRPDGLIIPLVLTVPANNSVVPAVKTFPLLEGFLLSIVAFINGGATVGFPTYLQVGIGRTPFGIGNVFSVLLAGYMEGNQPLSWPGYLPVRAKDDNPWYASQQQGNPAAGADWTFTIPAGTRKRVVSVSALLTTAVAVANRFASIIIDDGVNIVAQIPSGFAQAASLANQYTFADSTTGTASASNVSIASLPSNLILPAGFRVRSLTGGIQAADQWSNIFFLFGSLFDPL